MRSYLFRPDDLSMKNSKFSKTVHTIGIKFSSHSTPKGAPACAKSYVWDLRNSQNWSKNNQMTMKYVLGKSAPSFFSIFWLRFHDFRDIKPINENVCNAISSKILFKSFLYHTVSWCLQKFAETNWYEVVPLVHLGLN